jgi:hypothetical protein
MSSLRHTLVLSPQQLRVLCWCVAIAAGFLQAWSGRDSMGSDGMSYLDISSAYLRGDWKSALNAYWSPLYSWAIALGLLALRPSPDWEFPVVHLVNFGIYLASLASFDFFWRTIIDHQRQRQAGLAAESRRALPEEAWLGLGYALFIWSSLHLITLSGVHPDMAVSALVYLAAGLIVRIRREGAGWSEFALLGLVLGLGYLAKAAMFPLALIFLGVSLFAAGDLRRAVPRLIVALTVFLAVASPFVLALSRARGHLTLGETGKLNYIWYANGSSYRPWTQSQPDNQRPWSATRRLLETPPVYEFAAPFGGTYPPWYDPSYWNTGLRPRFEPKAQLRALLANLLVYYDRLLTPQYGLIGAVSLLFWGGSRRWSGLKDVAENWFLVAPAAAALTMYALVVVETRYVAPFVLLLWAAVFLGIRLPSAPEPRRLAAAVTVIGVLTLAGSAVYSTAWRHLKGDDACARIHREVARGLKQMGLQPGDRVACIGIGAVSYWARLARVSLVAELPQPEAGRYWLAGPAVRCQVIEAFRKTGARLIVADSVPVGVSQTGWQQIGQTGYYAYSLPHRPSRLARNR